MSNMLPSAFAEWLSAQLSEQGLSAKNFSELCGVSEATISRIKSGKHRLTPTMKRKIALALKCDVAQVPYAKKFIPAKEVDSIPTVRLVHTSDTPVAMLSYAAKSGIFSQNNIYCKPYYVSDYGAAHLEAYRLAIIELLKQGQPVLAIGCKDLPQLKNLSHSTAIYSHTCKSHYLACRADVNFPILEGQPEMSRMITLKHILDLMDDGGVWHEAGSANRVSWQENCDFQFISSLKGLARELCGGVKYEPTEQYFFANKQGLSALHAVGRRGADFLTAGVTNLAQIYAHPERYRVLFQSQTLKNVISGIQPQEAPNWSEILKGPYHADKRETALMRFRAFWVDRMDALVTPFYWHIFWPDQMHPVAKRQMETNLTAARDALHGIFASSMHREQALREIYTIISSQIVDLPFDFESFVMAWVNMYEDI